MAGCPAAAGSSRRDEETLKSRVGVFGGTFDPVHVGHLAIALAALESVPLDRVVFVPARRSPLKDRDPLANVADRVTMLQAAIAGEPRFSLSRVELDRDGVSYTVDTLEALRSEGELFLIRGPRTLASARSDPRAVDDPGRGAARRPGAGPDAPCTCVRRATTRYQLAGITRQSRPRYVPALPCSGRSVGAHQKARPLSVTASTRAELPPRALADLVVEAASDKKAEDILVLNISEVSTIADLFVICSARGERQAQGIADGIIEKAKAAGQQPFGIEGYDGGRWILIDLSDVVVHVFVPEERELYRLERLWGDAPVVLRIA
jgi:ribosome-associated protein